MPSSAFWDRLPALFVDPVTGLSPASERELSACLCLLQDRGQISWDRIFLLSPNGSLAGVKAASLFPPGGTMLAEYLLCAREYQDISTWGSMPADLIYVSADNRNVVIVENKIGSRLTSGGGDVETGQLARQAEYLCCWKDRRPLAGASLILLTTTECLKSRNYLQVFTNTLAHANRCERIQGFVMLWEDIFDACSDTGFA